MKHLQNTRKKCWIHEFATPLGRTIAAVTPDTDDRDALIRLSFLSGDHTSDDVIQELVAQGYSPEWNEEALDDLEKQLGEYFRGTRKTFDIVLAPEGTEFQKRVWAELLRIPYGETISYVELARRVGNPKSSRAVGGANGSNPIWLIVPCHRVIGSNGTLTGYAGGVGIKQALLELEGAKFKNITADQPKIKTDLLPFVSKGVPLFRS
jgi:methylated-DNA-[protein]-cysteine S-methyltransferase